MNTRVTIFTLFQRIMLERFHTVVEYDDEMAIAIEEVCQRIAAVAVHKTLHRDQ